MTGEQIKTVAKWIVGICAALIVVALLIHLGASSAKADGMDEGIGGYKDVPVYSHRNYRASSYRDDCSPYLTASECRRIRAKIAERAERRRYGDVRPVRRIYRDEEPRIRYAASRSSRYDVEESRGRSCKATIRVEGRERGTEARAQRSAENEWREAVKSRWGYDFLAIPRNADMRCRVIRTNYLGVAIRTCTLSARPCSGE